jgi:CDP-diacylglycerol--glycerol-3-phosphate 3-phosphatidyltransferase
VGFAERTERMLLALVPAGLTGLGVPYVLAVGLWVLAVLSVVTFGQRVAAVRRGAASQLRSAALDGGSRPGGGEAPDEPRAERERERPHE